MTWGKSTIYTLSTCPQRPICGPFRSITSTFLRYKVVENRTNCKSTEWLHNDIEHSKSKCTLHILSTYPQKLIFCHFRSTAIFSRYGTLYIQHWIPCYTHKKTHQHHTISHFTILWTTLVKGLSRCMHDFFGNLVNLLCNFIGDVVWSFFPINFRSHVNQKERNS